MMRLTKLSLAAAILVRVPPRPRATIADVLPQSVDPAPAGQPMPEGLREDPELWNREVERRRQARAGRRQGGAR